MCSVIEKTTFKQQYISRINLFPTNTIAQRITVVRIKSGLTYKEFSKTIGVGIMTIYRWEKEIRVPSKIYLDKIITIFNLDINYFK